MSKQNSGYHTNGCSGCLFPYVLIAIIVFLLSLNDNTKPTNPAALPYSESTSGAGTCDYSWQTAKDGSRCGKRAADQR